MDSARIEILLQPFLSSPLSSEQLRHISMYIDILMRWNRKLNLTAVREPEAIVARHFGESLFAAQHLFRNGNADCSVVDVGSGAGFPGIPLKIFAPTIHLTLIESNHKKVIFLREVLRAVETTNAEVFAGRAEEFPPGPADVVTLRAVERFALILPVTAGILRLGGRLALLVGSSQVPITGSVLPEFEWYTAIPIPGSKERVLIIGRKEPAK